MTGPLHRIAITAGEPAGIGPDIVLDLARQEWAADLVVIADPKLLAERATRLGLPISLDLTSIAEPARHHQPGRLRVVPVTMPSGCTPGVLQPENAGYVLETLRAAVTGCQQGAFAAMVTAPVQKSVINDAGFPFSGHTEFLAEATGSKQVVMMLAAGELRVALATTHLPLAAVPAAITTDLLLRSIPILAADLQQKFGKAQPRIAVLGLNPHAGEAGHLGREELDTIIPALEKLRSRGLQLSGPLPADTAFNPRVLDACDAVFAMYHDQGLPVLKYAGFGNAVNITLGLPILRTSVDHGTALELAGTGRASADSLRSALAMAIAMCAHRDR